MQQFGGKNAKKTSSDSKRHFTVVMGNKEHGLYVSSSPSSAAKKAVTKLCTANKSKKVDFYIREITQGSKKKTYGPYTGYIEKLKEPIELKGRVIKYKPVAKLSKKSSKKMMGGEGNNEGPAYSNNEGPAYGFNDLSNNGDFSKTATAKATSFQANKLKGNAIIASEKAKQLKNKASANKINSIKAEEEASIKKDEANKLKKEANRLKNISNISTEQFKKLQENTKVRNVENSGTTVQRNAANAPENRNNPRRAANSTENLITVENSGATAKRNAAENALAQGNLSNSTENETANPSANTSSTIRANTSANGNNAAENGNNAARARAAIPTANGNNAARAVIPRANGNNARRAVIPTANGNNAAENGNNAARAAIPTANGNNAARAAILTANGNNAARAVIPTANGNNARRATNSTAIGNNASVNAPEQGNPKSITAAAAQGNANQGNSENSIPAKANTSENGNNARRNANRLSIMRGKKNPLNPNEAAFSTTPEKPKSPKKIKKPGQRGTVINI